VWSDISYEDERANYDPVKPRPVDVVKPDTALLRFYKKLTSLRKENPELIHGDLKFKIADDDKMVLAYTRRYNQREILVVFNRSDRKQQVNLEMPDYKKISILIDTEGIYGRSVEPGILGIVMEPFSALVIKGSLE
jgi:glycosidase